MGMSFEHKFSHNASLLSSHNANASVLSSKNFSDNIFFTAVLPPDILSNKLYSYQWQLVLF